MARKKNIPEEEIVNVTCEEAVPAEETLVDTTQPDETGADTGSFSVDSPDTVLPAEGSAEMSETLPTVDETAEETPSSDGGDAWGRQRKAQDCTKKKRSFLHADAGSKRGANPTRSRELRGRGSGLGLPRAGPGGDRGGACGKRSG